MRRNDAMWRRLLPKTTRHMRRPTLEQFEARLLLTTTYTVDTTDDNTLNFTENSLRNAILRSNANPSTTATPNQIQFNISADGSVQTINLQQKLPDVTASVVINGFTEPDASTTPIIAISGSNVSTGGSGLTITGGNSTVRGLSITGFANGSGIVLTGAGNDFVGGNYLGVIPAGTAAPGNGVNGIVVGSGADGSTINNNVIGGNLGNGISVDGTQGGSLTSQVTNTKITNNRVGVSPNGSTALANKSFGISVINAIGTVIGGSGVGNTVSGNYLGIYVGGGAATTTIQGNLIGTDGTGANAIPNVNTRANAATIALASPGDGIYLDGTNTVTIGGTASGTANTISGNSAYGINMVGLGSTGVTIQGNYIGTSRNATGPLGNVSGGIRSQGSTDVIGGTATGAGNVIGGNIGPGITVDFFSSGLLIQGNYIGTNSSGANNLGNGGPGVVTLFGSGTTAIGGLATGAGNVIAYNGGGSGNDGTSNGNGVNYRAGVAIGDGNGNSILSNSIYSNTTFGIQLGTDIFRPNNGIAAPDLISAISMKNTSEFTGTFQGAPGTYTVQFFTTAQLNGAGNAEGQTLIGTTSLNITTTGVQAFDLTLPVGFEPGGYVTATVTDSANNTSEFSPVQLVGTGQGPNDVAPVVSVTSSPTTVAAGDNVTYTFSIQNPSPVTDRGVAFAAQLPPGTTLFSGSATVFVFSNSAGTFVTAQVPVVVTNGVANVSLGNLLAGESSTVVLTLTTGSASVPSYTLTGNVTVVIPTFVLGTATATATTTVSASDDLYAFVNSPTTPIQVGQDATFQITVGNNGPSTGNNVQFLDNLPAGTTFVSATASNGVAFTESNGQVSANLGSIATSQLVTITLIVATTPNTPASILNTAGVSGTEPDSDSTNNIAAGSATVVPSSDLGILSETVAPTAVPAGQLVTYTITVNNNGPSPASQVVLSDILPAGVTFVSGSAAGGAVGIINGAVVAPVGTLANGAQSVVTITALAVGAGALTDAASISSAGDDPNPTNNTSSATVIVSPLTDLAITLSGPTTPSVVGEPFLYTAVVTNNGPSTASTVLFTDALFAGAQFIAAEASNGAVGSLAGSGIITLQLGALAAGQSVVVHVAINPSLIGTFTNVASVVGNANEPDTNLANNSAMVTTTVTAPQFAIGFAAPTFAAAETSGFATITLVRLGDQTGDVTVLFSTATGGNARAGVDYVPTSTLVTFPSGVSTETVTVPVLANPNDSTNENVNLLVTSPTGQGIFGGGATSGSATLTIINTDPLLNGPIITDVRIVGPVNSITGVELQTTGKLNSTTATLASNYSFTSVTTGVVVPVGTVAYDATTGKVFLLPSSPLPSGQVFTLRVNGTGTNAITDLAGNPLNSSLIGNVAGSDFTLNIARGKTLTYLDQNGVRVTLKVTGPGVLDLNQATSGLVERLQVVSPTKATRLDGTVAGKSHRTTIGSVVGLKQFGTVKTGLSTPPFYVTNTIYPNLQSLNNGTSADTLIGSSTTTTKGTKAKAKAVSAASVAHPHAQVAQTLHTATTAHKGKIAR